MSHYTTIINPDNYREKIKGLDLATMPDILRKSHDFVEKNTLQFTQWGAMTTSDTINRMFSTYFVKLNEWLESEKAKQTPKTKVKKETAQKAVKPKKVKAEKPSKADKSTFTAHFQTAEQLLKAFVNLDGKAATIRKIQLLHSRFQKAIIEKKVKSINPNATIFKQAASKLAKLYQKMTEGNISTIEKLEITGIEKFSDIKAEFQNLKIAPAVTLLKRFVGMEGTKPTIAKVQSLIKGMESALKAGKIKKEGVYHSQIDQALAHLKEWLAAKQDSYIQIEEAQLAGLAGLGCTCQNKPLAGTPAIKKKTLRPKVAWKRRKALSKRKYLKI
ncbi:hypothetical protein [Adhaeribacter pallidiroseus]|uniref:Uncharacterized protein n=1 Tax=Adhaeribacter pallidiroseus TaxID=2072847 RepID=A0A369QK13_9BACT|nr:hypothetical protein [Adhaeribacter pallidiroseus]RDC65074.1 hypothetical protein AHMF7616_03697 [Adhaeribacter pallidiroseus]